MSLFAWNPTQWTLTFKTQEKVNWQNTNRFEQVPVLPTPRRLCPFILPIRSSNCHRRGPSCSVWFLVGIVFQQLFPYYTWQPAFDFRRGTAGTVIVKQPLSSNFRPKERPSPSSGREPACDSLVNPAPNPPHLPQGRLLLIVAFSETGSELFWMVVTHRDPWLLERGMVGVEFVKGDPLFLLHCLEFARGGGVDIRR